METYEERRFAKASMSNTENSDAHDQDRCGLHASLQLVIYTAIAALMFLVLFHHGVMRPPATWWPISTAAGLLPKPIRQLSSQLDDPEGVAGAEHLRTAGRGA